jgi:hypothetical protein
MLQTLTSFCKHLFCSALSAYGVLWQVTGNWKPIEAVSCHKQKNTSATQLEQLKSPWVYFKKTHKSLCFVYYYYYYYYCYYY